MSTRPANTAATSLFMGGLPSDNVLRGPTLARFLLQDCSAKAVHLRHVVMWVRP
jgi:hypothetical protein